MKSVAFILAFGILMAAGNSFAKERGVEEIKKGSVFELKTDIRLKYSESSVFDGVRAAILSTAEGHQTMETGNWDLYTSMHCELHAKKSESKVDILLKKGMKLKVKQVISARTENAAWFEDDAHLLVIAKYLSKYGEDQIFADIAFDHPAIDKISCIFPGTYGAFIETWFLKQSIGELFKIKINQRVEVYTE